MARLVAGPVSIHYEVTGDGPPVLLLAPGGLDSTIDAWSRAAIDPFVSLAGRFRLIAMDQRNAGSSFGPLEDSDPWGSYVEDQLALVDHLGLEQFAVMGCCIGCSYALGLAHRAPERVRAVVLEQPIGLTEETYPGWVERRSQWSERLCSARDDLDEAVAARFVAAMWDRDFVGILDRSDVSGISAPVVVLPGVDAIHPRQTALEFASLLPNAELIDPWRDRPDDVEAASAAIASFLLRELAD